MKKKRTRARFPGYPQIPEAIDPDYDRKSVLVKFAIMECENGGKIITAEFSDASRNTTYRVYQVRPEQELMDILATALVEARLK